MDKAQEHAIVWDCQKVWRQYYHYVDHHDYDNAIKLFTEDVTCHAAILIVLYLATPAHAKS